MDATSLVAIDINPGGEFGPAGEIGLAEISSHGIGAAFHVRFHQSYAPAKCDPWPPPSTANCPAAGSTSGGRLADFVDVWPYVEAFVADRPVIAYNRGYDYPELRHMLQAHQLPTPAWTTYCGLALARQFFPHTGGLTLQAVALTLGLFDAAELDRRRAVHRAQPPPRGKWLLHTARDDAGACAQLVVHAMRERDESLAEVLAGLRPRQLGEHQPRRRARSGDPVKTPEHHRALARAAKEQRAVQEHAIRDLAVTIAAIAALDANLPHLKEQRAALITQAQTKHAAARAAGWNSRQLADVGMSVPKKTTQCRASGPGT